MTELGDYTEYDIDPKVILDVLRGEAEPLARFGVSTGPVPWWRRRIQRYVAPARFRLWAQRRILDRLDEENH